MKNIVCFLVAFGMLATQAWAASVNIDFESYGDYLPADSYGAAAGQSGTWNGLRFNVGNQDHVYFGDLLGLTGQHSGVSYSATGMYYPTIGSSIDPLIRDSFAAYSYLNKPFWSVSLSGLTSGLYDIYVYAPTHSSTPTGNFTVNGVAVNSFGYATSGAGANGLNSLDVGIDYVVLPNLNISAGSLNFVQTGYGIYVDNNGNQQNAWMAGLAGIQVVGAQVPLPSTLILLGAGLLGLVGLRRRMK